MATLTRLREATRRAHQRHRRATTLRRELATYRSPAEHAELTAIFARHQEPVPERLGGRG
jgi:hypothetical protein